MNDYGRPLRLFVMNLLRMGFRLWVGEDGCLHVRPPEKNAMPPALQPEIERRAVWLVEILRPFPEPMQAWYGRLLTRAEKEQAFKVAVKHGYTFTATPAGGKWLIEVSEP